jgi:hypothetical protein
MEYSDDNCEVLGLIVVDAKEIIWRMRVPKKDAKDITAYHLTEHYFEMKYAETAGVDSEHLV